MNIKENIKSEEELKCLADKLLNEISNTEEIIISRFVNTVYDSVKFVEGKKSVNEIWMSNFNKENISRSLYTDISTNSYCLNSFEEIVVARDLDPSRFNFDFKMESLPKYEKSFFDSVPDNIDYFDREFLEFSKSHLGAACLREMAVQQKIVVNSAGGVCIQSIPFMKVSFFNGLPPLYSSRDVVVRCTTNDDVKNLPKLIKYFADPTPDRRVSSKTSFAEAFEELYTISNLKYATLEDAGIPIKGLYDVVVLSGFSAHEIFGHHFEEPINFLNSSDSAPFKRDQIIDNKDIILTDDHMKTVEGFQVQGFTYFDAYGRQRPIRTHIKDGVVRDFLGSEYIDSDNIKNYLNMAHSEFKGNASQFTDGGFPQPRMSCTVLKGKSEAVDLEGKILIVPSGGETSPKNHTYVVNSNECYIVRNGEPLRIMPLNMSGGINQAFANMVLLPEYTYSVGMCSKPEPIGYNFPAQVPVSQFTKNQLWQGQQIQPASISDVHKKILIEK
ncbi:hypothetical protein HOK51_07605 [Candidatus Woesearchaeota archaeon]|jgi:hypothetical protein|nr:hypothetical protein [Candidatus Woesearchaeota archaeon]MBT6519689.1 hypothetical protein [Candidatus Woesearchaeota archaeon]MBT7367380.1 hypothetical protein [Candidatus Woesearchaeota archaeon]